MKILIISPYFYPHKGGVEQFNFELAKRLATTEEITVLSSKFDNEKPTESKEGFQIKRFNHYNLLGQTLPVPKDLKGIKKAVQSQPDLIITSTRFFPINFFVARFARKNKVKLLHIEHGSEFVTLNSKTKTLLAKLYDLTIGSYVIKSANIVFGISKASEEFAKKLGAKETDFLYNSVDCKFFDGIKKKHNGTIITYVGRLIYAKGVHDLIRAFVKIEDKNLSLNIVGSGNYEHDLKEIAGSDKRIKFLGQMNQDEIKSLLSQTDIFVNPSYNEGLPTSVLEAGAMKCAVIATDVGGTREIIDNNQNGLLIETGNTSNLESSVEQIIKDEAFREKLAFNLKEKIIDKFCWEKNISEFKNKLKHLHLP